MEVEAEIPISYIKIIPIVALEYRVAVADDAVQAFGLRHAGNAGFYLLAEGGIGNDRGEALAVGGHIGAGPYEAHRTQEYIKKLR